jgi:hypothetical protein
MAAGSKRPNLQTGVARRHSLHRKVSLHFSLSKQGQHNTDLARSRQPQTLAQAEMQTGCAIPRPLQADG